MRNNRFGHNLSSRFNVGEPFDDEKITLPVDSEEKRRVESFIEQLHEDVSRLVGESYLNLVAKGQMDNELAATLANSGIPAVHERVKYGNTHTRIGNMGNIGMQLFVSEATQVIRQDMTEYVDSESPGWMGKDQLVAAIKERDERLEAIGKYVDDSRKAVQQHYYDIAEKWASRHDIPRHEACHGIAWEIQNNYGDNYAIVGDYSTKVNPGQEYAALYDKNQAPNIDAGLAMRAADLFT